MVACSLPTASHSLGRLSLNVSPGNILVVLANESDVSVLDQDPL